MQEINKKICSKCGKEKSIVQFYRRYAICKFCFNSKRGTVRIENLRKKVDIDWKKYARLFWEGQVEKKIKYPHIEPINEDILKIEDEYCIEFGCGRKLGLREKLFGKKCINHQILQNSLVEYR